MTPFDIFKPPAGTPEDPMAMNFALTQRPISELFATIPDVPASVEAGSTMIDPVQGMQVLSYDPQAGHTIPWADGRGEMDAGMMGVEPPPNQDDDAALEDAYLQQAMQERDVSRGMSERVRTENLEEERVSRGKMGL